MKARLPPHLLELLAHLRPEELRELHRVLTEQLPRTASRSR